MKITRPIIWAGLVFATAALIFLLSPQGEGDKSKPDNLQAYATHSLAKLQVFEDPQPLPAFMFKTNDGVEHNLSEFKGKVVLLNLWATWCAPCVAEMPSLDRLQGAYDKGKLVVLPLSLDFQGAEKVNPFFERLNIQNLDVFTDEKNLSMRALRAGTLPISILIDTDGRMLARLNGPAEWDSAEAKGLIQSVVDHR